MSELLPCPFCGSPAELERDNDHHGEWFNLGCSRHWGKNLDDVCVGARLWYTESELPEADAIAAWNTRASQAEIERLGAERAEQWRLRREAIADRDMWNAVASAHEIEISRLRAALEEAVEADTRPMYRNLETAPYSSTIGPAGEIARAALSGSKDNG